MTTEEYQKNWQAVVSAMADLTDDYEWAQRKNRAKDEYNMNMVLESMEDSVAALAIAVEKLRECAWI